MSIVMKANIGWKIILNNTGFKWNELQNVLNEKISKDVFIHTLNTSEMDKEFEIEFNGVVIDVYLMWKDRSLLIGCIDSGTRVAKLG